VYHHQYDRHGIRFGRTTPCLCREQRKGRARTNKIGTRQETKWILSHSWKIGGRITLNSCWSRPCYYFGE
jgi:hypothetical protein